MRGRVANDATGRAEDKVVHLVFSSDGIVRMRVEDPGDRPIEPLTPYKLKVVTLRRRGLHYPYEVVRLLAPPPHLGSRYRAVSSRSTIWAPMDGSNR